MFNVEGRKYVESKSIYLCRDIGQQDFYIKARQKGIQYQLKKSFFFDVITYLALIYFYIYYTWLLLESLTVPVCEKTHKVGCNNFVEIRLLSFSTEYKVVQKFIILIELALLRVNKLENINRSGIDQLWKVGHYFY